MKFPQLPIGARFEFEGKAYVKAGPVAATSEDGQQRLIPRWAVLKSLDGWTPPPPPPPDARLNREHVLAAFETYHTCCLNLVAGSEEAEQRLEHARQDFLNRLLAPAGQVRESGRPE